MLYYIPLAIIIAGIAVILTVLFRRFPQAANLDVNNLPEEKMYKTKQEIIEKRIEAGSDADKETMLKILVPLKKIWLFVQKNFRSYAGKVYRMMYHEQNLNKRTVPPKESQVTADEKDRRVSQLVQDAERCLNAKEFEKAEEYFIAAIKINAKSAPAYRGLGDSYMAKNSLEEARQTYRFLLQLEPDDDSVLVKLAEIAESQGDLEEAIGYYQQAVLVNDAFSARFHRLAELLNKVGQPEVAKEAALQSVELEPQNSKYLDLLLEIAIICGDKALAIKTFNDLRLINPNNQKLDGFKDRMGKLDASFSPPRV